MKKIYKAVLVGSGGFGVTYLNFFLNKVTEDFELIGVVDPYAKRSSAFERFDGVYPIYERLEDFFNTGLKTDLVIIASPIHLHYSQCMTALENGVHVLCEKPIVPTVKELDTIEQKAKEVGKSVSVGFQWCYSKITLELKKRILEGRFGKPKCLKTIMSTPRDHAYYARNSWAGKKISDDGDIIYDSVISNATSHHMQNILFLLGDDMESSASLKNVRTELYRANNIETFDTCVLKGETDSTTVLFATTHAANHSIGPMNYFIFEDATIFYNVIGQNNDITIHYKNGEIEKLGNYLMNGTIDVVNHVAKIVNGTDSPICTPKTVRPFTNLIETMFLKSPINNFNEKYVVTLENQTYVKHLHIDLMECFFHNKLPSDISMPWSKSSF